MWIKSDWLLICFTFVTKSPGSCNAQRNVLQNDGHDDGDDCYCDNFMKNLKFLERASRPVFIDNYFIDGKHSVDNFNTTNHIAFIVRKSIHP